MKPAIRYTKKTNAEDSGEHLLELGYVTMRNLLPNQPYQEVLMPSELQLNMPVDRQVSFMCWFMWPEQHVVGIINFS